MLLRFETEDEQIQEYMIQWAKNISHGFSMEKWEKLLTKKIKFSLNVTIKENRYKMIYRWNMTS